MRRFAFTLIELIFALLLIGVLGAVGTALYKPGRGLHDARYAALRLQQTRYEAIGYDHRSFGGGAVAAGPGCVTLTRSGLEGNLSRAGAYRFDGSTAISVSGMAGNTLCFDAKGRPHDGDFSLASLLHETVDISVENRGAVYRLTIFPVSGYVKMNR